MDAIKVAKTYVFWGKEFISGGFKRITGIALWEICTLRAANMIFWKLYDYFLTFFNFTLKTITNSILTSFSCLLISKDVSFCSQNCSLRGFYWKS